MSVSHVNSPLTAAIKVAIQQRYVHGTATLRPSHHIPAYREASSISCDYTIATAGWLVGWLGRQRSDPKHRGWDGNKQFNRHIISVKVHCPLHSRSPWPAAASEADTLFPLNLIMWPREEWFIRANRQWDTYRVVPSHIHIPCHKYHLPWTVISRI